MRIARADEVAQGSPRRVTRGEILPPRVVVDWLSFTWEWERLDAHGMCGMMSVWFGGRVMLQHQGRGFLGFSSSAKILIDVGGEAQVVGMIAWGGGAQGGRALVSLPGTGCAAVVPSRWSNVHAGLAAIDARITRVDLAIDDLEGEFSVDTAVEWFRAGEFAQSAGRPPSYSCAGDWLESSGAGRTLYVGKSKNGKMLRVYEKGRQLGDASSPWVRWEVQLGNKDRVIPHDVVISGENYFCGAYGVLARVVRAAAERIKCVRVSLAKSLEKLVIYARRSYGRLVSVLLEHHGGDLFAVVDALRLPGVPASLVHGWLAADRALAVRNTAL